MDGQPLRYRRNADGTFLLYSIGENGKDDGGNPSGNGPSIHLSVIPGKTLTRWIGSGRSRRRPRKFKISTSIRQSNLRLSNSRQFA